MCYYEPKPIVYIKIHLLGYSTVVLIVQIYLKVEHSYETFPELKWHITKKQLPLIHMENYFSIPRLQK